MTALTLFLASQAFLAAGNVSAQSIGEIAAQNVAYRATCTGFVDALQSAIGDDASDELTPFPLPKAERVLEILSVFPGASPVVHRVARWLRDSDASLDDQKAVIDVMGDTCQPLSYWRAAYRLIATAKSHPDAADFRRDLLRVIRDNSMRDSVEPIIPLGLNIQVALLSLRAQEALLSGAESIEEIKNLRQRVDDTVRAMGTGAGTPRKTLLILEPLRRALVQRLAAQD